MRFGISATSWIFPKNFLTRLRPVNVCAIVLSLLSFGWEHRDDSPKSRYPSRLSGQAYGCPFSGDSAVRTAHCTTRLRRCPSPTTAKGGLVSLQQPVDRPYGLPLNGKRGDSGAE